MENILIAGCGYSGTQLGVELAEREYSVYGLRRSTKGLPPEIKPVHADVTDPSTLSSLPESLDGVFFLVSPDGHDASSYRSTYINGLQNLLDALRSRRPERILFASSTAVYGQSNGQWVDETSATNPDSHRGSILLDAEDLLIEDELPGLVVRFGGIYGPDRTRYISRVKSGNATCYGDEPLYSNRNHVKDVARALHHLLTLDDPDDVYNATDGNPSDRCGILRWLADRLDAPPPNQKPIETAPDRIRSTNKRVRNRRLLDTGFEFRYPSYRDGFRAILNESDEHQ